MSLRQHLTLVPRRSLREWQRDRQVQIFAELSALRADLKRLVRLSTAVKRCEVCRVLKTVSIQDDGWWKCNRCAESAKGATA